MKVCILAGGSGSRLWPYSKPDLPKQFLPILQGKELFTAALERALSVAEKDDVFIVAKSGFAPAIEDFIAPFGIKKENILLEPEQKNTAAAIAYALKALKSTGKLFDEEPIFFTPSDHFVEENALEWNLLVKAGVEAVSKGHIALFGIPPTRPETGFGYIKSRGNVCDKYFSIEEFVEKPHFKKAEGYLKDGSYFWNSGMFFFTYSIFAREIKKYCQALNELLESPLEKSEEIFQALSPISIDCALMEKTKVAVLIPFTLRWSDLGTWESVYENSLKDEKGNVLGENVFTSKTQNTFVFGSKRFVSCIGVDDLVVIDSCDILLIAKKSETQEAISKTLAYLEEKKENSSFEKALSQNSAVI